MKAKVLILLVGLLLGLAAAVLFPRFRDQLTPGVLRPAPTEGVVEDKRSEGDRLLLTLVTADGAVLATFTKKVAEIDLLVTPGDTVSLGLDGYRPFVEDPEIERVVKAPPREEAVQPIPTAESPGDSTAQGPGDPTAEGSIGPPISESPVDPEVESPMESQPEPASPPAN